jgi:hypothetical protein
MSGTIVVDRIESDASYASSINIASPLIISNIVNMNLDGAAQVFNRTTSDGDILQFKKDGTTVGSIGAPFATALHITGPGSNGAGLVFQENDIIAPARNGARSADTQDLGNSLFRFKDLYLSGSVYLGGTAAANALDDYEEGTWTPVITNFTTNSGTFAGTGTYTKIGNMVTVRMYQTSGNISWTGGSSYITGLPFAPDSTLGGAGSYTNGTPNIQGSVLSYVSGGVNGQLWMASNQSSQTSLIITATYFVA